MKAQCEGVRRTRWILHLPSQLLPCKQTTQAFFRLTHHPQACAQVHAHQGRWRELKSLHHETLNLQIEEGDSTLRLFLGKTELSSEKMGEAGRLPAKNLQHGRPG